MKSKIVLIGMPGCGKTTIGIRLATELSMNFMDMDEYIEEKSGQSIAKLFEQGEEYFRNLETMACKELIKYDNVLISTGGGVIKKKINIDILNKESLIIFIDRPLEKILQDVDTSTRPLIKDDKQRLLKLYEERYDIYKSSADEIVVNDKDLPEVINKIKALI